MGAYMTAKHRHRLPPSDASRHQMVAHSNRKNSLTLRCRKRWFPNLPFGSMPLIAFSKIRSGMRCGRGARGMVGRGSESL